MSDKENQKQSISDDQELAKALAGVTEEADNIKLEDTGVAPAPVAPAAAAPIAPSTPPPAMAPPAMGAPMPPANQPMPNLNAGAPDPGLANIKQAALAELRPLVDKLDVDPEEKFNTYLLLIRSTDDKELIAPAHEAAKSITDEGKKAQALLDIIKEIDFLSNSQK